MVICFIYDSVYANPSCGFEKTEFLSRTARVILELSSLSMKFRASSIVSKLLLGALRIKNLKQIKALSNYLTTVSHYHYVIIFF